MKKTVTDTVKRRQFLKNSALTGAVIGSGAVTGEVLAETLEEKPVKSENKGYQETDHIREYYRVARF